MAHSPREASGKVLVLFLCLSGLLKDKKDEKGTKGQKTLGTFKAQSVYYTSCVLLFKDHKKTDFLLESCIFFSKDIFVFLKPSCLLLKTIERQISGLKNIFSLQKTYMLHCVLRPPQPTPPPLYQPFAGAEENPPLGPFNADESMEKFA